MIRRLEAGETLEKLVSVMFEASRVRFDGQGHSCVNETYIDMILSLSGYSTIVYLAAVAAFNLQRIVHIRCDIVTSSQAHFDLQILVKL